MIKSIRIVISAVLALAFAASARAQDLYDITTLRTFNFVFHDANWLTLLAQNYASQTNILADLTVDGVTYPSVGVRIRGNTSYTALPAGSQKFSLNVEMDASVVGQTIMGTDSLNLNNGFHDPTFCREVVYNNYVAQYMPNPRANLVTVTLNGANWGVYINVEQFNKDMLRRYFADEDGLRIKCANNPNGPGLRYNGASASGYTGYEIKNDGGLADPWTPLIAVCNSVTNEPLATWPNIDTVFAIDPSIWSTVFENVLTDDDSYVNKGADFMLYRNPTDGRMHLLQTDANETFTQSAWSPTLNFASVNKPVLSHVLAVAELRQRYMAHMRAVKNELTWAYFEPRFTALRNLIDAAVQADPKKLYSYALFQQNFTTSVTLPYAGPAGGTVPGLQQFITARAATLNAVTEVAANGPTINWVQVSGTAPDPLDPVWITSSVVPNGSAISKVECFYRANPAAPYQRVQMFDNGTSGDGAAGDGVFGVLLPVSASSGQRVSYYVGAVAANAFLSSTFSPTLSENGPLALEYTFGQSGVRITEYMYSGPSGEFVELTNRTSRPIDLTGWSMDDDSAVPGTFSLSSAGTLAPGQSIIVTDVAPATFRTAWGLSGSVVVLGPNTVAALGRNDQINIYDASNGLVERLSYGDETFPGTIRTQNKSGQTCSQSIGQNAIAEWELSILNDAYGSYAATTAELGTPGTYVAPSCLPCPADITGNGTVAVDDLLTVIAAWGPCPAPPTACPADIDASGAVNVSDLLTVISAWGACP